MYLDLDREMNVKTATPHPSHPTPEKGSLFPSNPL